MKKVLAAVLAATTLASMSAISSISAFAASEYDVDIRDTQMYTDNDTSKTYSDPIASDSSVYVLVDDVLTSVNAKYSTTITESQFADSDYFKVKFDKGDNNAKLVKKMSLVQKDDPNTASTQRKWWLKVEIAEFYTDDEFKITPSFIFTSKTDDKATPTTLIPDGDKIYANLTIFVKNGVKNADADTDNGTGGMVIAPTKDDTNEIIWNDENNEVARLTFMGDSDVDKFYSKLSTKWNNDVYEEMFKNQNAFKFEFVAQPTISSTSRATLELYNPYVNDDGDETVDPSTITIYQVTADGGLLDVTDQFTYGTNDNDNAVFSTQTRTLGYYIMAEEPVETADDEITDDIGDIDDGAIDVEDANKLPPNTGSF